MAAALRPSVLINLLIWLAITAFGGYFLYNIFKTKPGEKGLINFGIDLVGGTYLTLDVKVEEAVKNDLMGAMQGLIDKLKKEKLPSPDGAPKIDDKALTGTLSFQSDLTASQAVKLYGAPGEHAPYATQKGKEVHFAFSGEQLSAMRKEVVESNIAILRTRLDAFGAGEITIVPQGERRIGIELPNVSDPEKAKARVGTAAVLELKPVYDKGATKEQLLERLGGKIPEGTMIIMGRKGDEGGAYLVPVYAKVTGKLLKNAKYVFRQDGSFGRETPHVVSLQFKNEGIGKFAELTKDNLNKPLGIILDNILISAPTVNAVIEDGNAIISGAYDQEGAEELVALLKSGAFSAPVEVIEERSIGPSLGAESIHKGLVSCGIALLLLFLFSIFVYKVAGLLAFVVLLYNLLLILFGLALVPDATLTLPGIAGMILTVGMAIDSSILIYERIKEELANGASLRKAVDSGFNGALTVILDANITTFIVGAVLYYMGSAAIQGFALTLMIGIAATLITGLVLLRTLFNALLDFGVTRLSI